MCHVMQICDGHAPCMCHIEGGIITAVEFGDEWILSYHCNLNLHPVVNPGNAFSAQLLHDVTIPMPVDLKHFFTANHACKAWC